MSKAPNGENGFDNLHDELIAAVGLHPEAGVVTRLESLGLHWRQAATAILKKTDAKAYATYRAMKYADGATENPDLTTRREAYLWAAMHVIEQHFDHPICEGWRQLAAKAVEALDPATGIKYREAKYGAGEPDKATKIEAYKIVVRRFLELSYTIINL